MDCKDKFDKLHLAVIEALNISSKREIEFPQISVSGLLSYIADLRAGIHAERFPEPVESPKAQEYGVEQFFECPNCDASVQHLLPGTLGPAPGIPGYVRTITCTACNFKWVEFFNYIGWKPA